MSTPSIEALPVAAQIAVYAIGGLGYMAAIAVAYFKGLPSKKAEPGSSVTVAGALLSNDDADRILGALHSNSRSVERLERCLDRTSDEVQRLTDHLIAERRRNT
jgi:hypothetical protein